MLFIVSEIELRAGSADGDDDVRVEVEKAPGVKCERCWRWVPMVRSEPDWAGICDRCVESLAEPVNR
jgi:isoleucyl-tRNA synthetase